LFAYLVLDLLDGAAAMAAVVWLTAYSSIAELPSSIIPNQDPCPTANQ
jgi:hypothetical protein